MPQRADSRLYEFAGFRLDPVRRLVRGTDGEPIPLQSRVFDTLLCFVEHAGELLDKDRLMRAVWGRVTVEENSLNQHISILRRIFGELPGENRFIVTVPGRGYRFVADVRAIPATDGPAEDAGAAVTAPEPGRAPGGRRAWLGYAAAGLAIVAVAAGLAWRFVPGNVPKALAALPCDNLSPSPGDAYFAAGIHEDVLLQLARIEGVRVVPRASVLRYADSRLPAPAIGRELGVGFVLSCSVRYADDRVRISAELVDAATDRYIWNGSYDRDFTDVFAIQTDIATNIAAALETELGAGAPQVPAEYTAAPSLAYALVLESRNIVLTRQGMTAWDQAKLLLDRAIEIEPGYARAYARMADLYVQSFTNARPTKAETAEAFLELAEQGRDYAERALSLDPDDRDARDALDLIDIFTWHWSRIEDPADRGDALRPRLQHLWLLSWLGRHDDAIRIGERIAELDPHAVDAHFGLGVVYSYARRPEDALRSVRRALELAPGNALGRIWVAHNEIALGQLDEAAADLELVERLAGDYRTALLSDLAYSYSRVGRMDDAARIVAEIEELGWTASIGAGERAMASLAIGDEAGALQWLESAAEQARRHAPDHGFYDLMLLKMNVLRDPRLEQTPFAGVLDRIGGS